VNFYYIYRNANKIDVNCLLKDFQNFWRENSEIWVDLSCSPFGYSGIFAARNQRRWPDNQGN
jgi:hypothetical protein